MQTKSYSMRSVLFWLCCLLPLLSDASEKRNLYITTGWTEPVSTIFRGVLSEVAHQNNLDLKLEWMSGERSLMLANQGLTDGECCRIPQVVNRDYPQLLHVPESFFSAHFSAFTNNAAVEVNSWDDLSQYTVATVLGYKIVLHNLERIGHKENFVVKDHDAAFKMLDLVRVDVVVVGYTVGLHTLYKNNIKGVRVLKPELASKPLYLMLHKNNQHLIAPFTKSIREMKRSGAVSEIERKIMNQFAPETVSQ